MSQPEPRRAASERLASSREELKEIVHRYSFPPEAAQQLMDSFDGPAASLDALLSFAEWRMATPDDPAYAIPVSRIRRNFEHSIAESRKTLAAAEAQRRLLREPACDEAIGRLIDEVDWQERGRQLEGGLDDLKKRSSRAMRPLFDGLTDCSSRAVTLVADKQVERAADERVEQVIGATAEMVLALEKLGQPGAARMMGAGTHPDGSLDWWFAGKLALGIGAMMFGGAIAVGTVMTLGGAMIGGGLTVGSLAAHTTVFTVSSRASVEGYGYLIEILQEDV